MSAAKSMLAGAAAITTEVGAIVVADGLTEAELVIEVADTHQQLADAHRVPGVDGRSGK